MSKKSVIKKKSGVNFGAFQIAIFYLLIGSLWIVFSDEVVAILATDRVMLVRFSMIKGWAYIIVTAGLLYWLIQRYTAALHESEKSYRTLIEQASDGIFLADGEQRYIDVNSAGCSLLGYTREEILQLTMRDMIRLSPENPLRLEELRDGKIFLGEREMIRKDGTLVSVEISVRQLPNGYFQGIVRDITERKWKEQVQSARLRLSEFALSHSLDDVLQKTLDEAELLTGSQIGFYHFLNADQKTLTLQNWSTNTLKNMCKAEGKGHQYEVDQAGVWVDCIRERRPIIHNDFESLPYRKGLPEGHAPVIRELTIPVFRGDKIVAVLGVGNKPQDYTSEEMETISHLADLAWDITARKQAEQVLAASEAELRALFASMQDLAMVIDRDGVYCKIAPTNLDLLYKPLQEILGSNLRDNFSAEQAETFIGVIQQVLEKQQTIRIEYELIINGYPHWFNTSVSPMEEDTTLWVAHDITERKRAEDDLRRAKDELEVAHSELQQSLAHEQVLARTDGLTGICNRRYFFEIAVREFNAALRYQRPLTIIIFDADGLKRVNDSYGHEVGDKMLLMITQVAATHVRTVDVLARYGGDEFIILLPQTNVQQAFVIAERIRENVMAACVETDTETLTATVSVGVAETIHGARGESVEAVIHRADEALYIAKQGGHNRTMIFNPDVKLNSSIN